MRRVCRSVAGGLLVVLAAAFAGCGGGDTTAAPGSGFLNDTAPTEFKATDLTPFNDMQNQMKENAKKGAYKQKPTPPKEKSAEKAKS